MVRNLSHEKRDRFLSSALHLFVANGVLHTTTAEIAKEAGTAAGTLFLYFPTKQDLMNTLVLQIGQEQSDYVKSLFTSSLSAQESFWKIWNGSVSWFLEHMDAYQYIRQIWEAGVISEAVVLESNKFFGFYYDAIQKGLAEGSIKPYPPEMIGQFLYQEIVAILNLVRAQPDPARRDKAIQQGFAIFWDGIRLWS